MFISKLRFANLIAADNWKPPNFTFLCLQTCRRSLVFQVTSVAAAPNHTVVLCAASCPPLPHGASFSSVGPRSGAQVDDDDALTEGDLDSDGDEEEGSGDVESRTAGRDGLVSASADGGFEPLTLKQLCEAKLAQEVDLHNAGAVLAYAVGCLCVQIAQNRTLLWHSNRTSNANAFLLAVQPLKCLFQSVLPVDTIGIIMLAWSSLFFQDALDAPALVRFCAEFVRWNLDGILVMGRESDRSCLLEAPASGVVSWLCFQTIGHNRLE